MRFSYYAPSDELNIHCDAPKPCFSKEIADEIYFRLDIETRKIVGLTILNFRQRFKGAKDKELSFNLPVLANKRLSKSEAESLELM